MSEQLDLELLRSIFGDVRQHIGFGVISQLGLAVDGSALRVQVNLLPEQREIVAEMNFSDVECVTFPEVNDAVIVAFVDGHPDLAYVVGIYPSSEEPIPTFARGGNSVVYSRPGKKIYLGSDTKVGIGRKNVEPTEPLVLGAVFKTFMSTVLGVLVNTEQKIMDLVDAFNAHTHEGNLGYLTTPPQATDITAATVVKTAASGYKTTLNNQKSSPIDDSAVLSGIAFTEKGS